MGALLQREVTVNPKFGRRSWVKLWVNEWLDGTTRYEMSDAQRAFWIDLLAMAGRSRYPGIICAGKSPNDSYIGYPINKYQSLMSEPLNVEETLAMFARTGKISVEVTAENPVKLLKLELLNWDKYQSEYQRQKPYRKAAKLQKSDGNSYNQGNRTDTDTETEVEVKSSRLDDLKKSFLSKCTDPQGIVAAIVEIICERAVKSGVKIRTEAYFEKAVEAFDTTSGQDREELQERLKRVPL